MLTRGLSLNGATLFQRHVTGALYRPLVVLLEQDGTYKASDGILVREDADDVGAPP